MTPSEAAEAVLVAHQRYSIEGCLCGWAVLGASHPGHQVEMLRAAGLIVDMEPAPGDSSWLEWER